MKISRVLTGVVVIWSLFGLDVTATENRKGTYTEISADTLATKPERYFGKEVAVTGQILWVFGNQSFTVTSGGDRKPYVVVLVPKPMPPIGVSQKVTIIGVVRRFDSKGFTQTYDWFNTHLKEFREIARLDGGPVLIASSVRDHKGKVLWSASAE